jgi:hypothetical protein
MLFGRSWAWFALLLFLAIPLWARASLVYLYDFPGDPGSGLAVDQTNSEPANATFSDWSRFKIDPVPTADVFNSAYWNNSAFFDPTEYASFTVTANSGYALTLSQLTFDEMRDSGGPTKGRVSIFLNGSTTAYATFNYNPTASLKNQTFNFSDVSNVTTAEFRFYGWNGGTPDAGLFFDNVATTFDLVAVPIPERCTWLVSLVPMGIALFRVSRDLRSLRRRN